jgi:hypothetical protein
MKKNQHTPKGFSDGFSMITAISMIVLMSTVAIFTTNLSSKMTKTSISQYQREQAILLANSYTEYAIMAVMGNDRNGTNTCVRTINGTFGTAPNGYNARIQISYIGHTSQIANCAATRQLATLPNENDPLNVIIDAYIDYQDIDNPTGPNLTYHRRTVQKI